MSEHFYKIKITYDLYYSCWGAYYRESAVVLQGGDSEEEAIQYAISHIKFEHCCFDADSPNHEATKNFEGAIIETIC